MNNRMAIFFITIVVALALSGLSIFQAWDKMQSDKTAEKERAAADTARNESRESQNRANLYFEKLQAAQDTIEKLNKISLKKADKIIDKNNELIRAQAETLKQVLGDGIVRIKIFKGANDEPRFGLENTGNYTARDIKINLTEFTAELKNKFQDGAFNRSDLAQNNLSLPDFPYLKRKQIEVFKISGNNANQRAYEFSIHCQHASFMQYIIMDKDTEDLKWYVYFKLYQIVDGKWILLDENKSNNDPNNEYQNSLFKKYFVIGPYKITQDL